MIAMASGSRVRIRRREGREEVDAGHPLRRLLRDARADARAPVAAGRAVAGVPEPPHQLDPRAGYPLDAPPRRGRLVAEAVARQRRADHVEGIGWVAAVGDRVRQRPDDLEELDDRARPAMRQDQRKRVGRGRPDVQEVDREPVERRAELRQRVEPGLGSPPVVLLGPVAAEVLQVGERDALRPVRHGLALGPARSPQPLAQVVEVLLGDLEAELRQLIGHRAARSRRSAPPRSLARLARSLSARYPRSCRPGSRGGRDNPSRKVRTPQGKVVGRPTRGNPRESATETHRRWRSPCRAPHRQG